MYGTGIALSLLISTKTSGGERERDLRTTKPTGRQFENFQKDSLSKSSSTTNWFAALERHNKSFSDTVVSIKSF